MNLKFLMLAAGFGAVVCANADTVVQWDFNTVDGNASTGTLTPSTGAGTVTLVGGTTAFFHFGNGSSDPTPSPDNSTYSVGNYPAQGQDSGTAGFQVDTS